MNRGTKLLLTATLLASLAGFASAFDYGLELSNGAGWKNTGDGDWFSDHRLTGWMKIPFDNKNVNSLSIEGSANASKPANQDDLAFYLNLDLFRFSLVPVSKDGMQITLDAGRFSSSDSTSFVFNQKIDGAEMHGAFSFGNIDFLAGYTGLLNVRGSPSSLMSADDYLDKDTDELYAFGAKRLVGKCTVQLAQVFAKTDVILEASGQYDLREVVDSSSDAIVHTGYGTAMLTGGLVDSIYYTLSGTYQTGYLHDDSGEYSVNSLLASVRADMYPFAKNHLFAQFVYSPPENDFFSAFLPITFSPAGTLFASGYENLMRASAGWNYNPFAALNLDLGGKLFMYANTPSDADGMYLGTEITGGATYKATSELRFRTDGTLYLPQGEDAQYQASLKIIFNL
jgi:hypothetical protein